MRSPLLGYDDNFMFIIYKNGLLVQSMFTKSSSYLGIIRVYECF